MHNIFIVSPNHPATEPPIHLVSEWSNSMKNQHVSLRALIEAMDWESDFSRIFYWKSGNEFITLDDESQRWAEDGLDIKDAPEWMRQSIKHAIEIEQSYFEDYHALPDRSEVNEYEMMERFIQGMNDHDQAVQLADAIRGIAAFRRFKSLASDFGVIDEWYHFKEGCYKAIAIRWCEGYDLPYEDDTK